MTDDLCACGRALHYSDATIAARVTQLVDWFGPNTRVTTPEGTWLVPRHYIALHGISAQGLSLEADVFGFEKVTT